MADETKEPKAAGEKRQPVTGRQIRCPVCDSPGDEIPAEKRTCQCEECGALFLNPRPSVGEIRKQREKRFEGKDALVLSAAIRHDSNAAVEVMRGYNQLASGKNAPLNAFGKRILDIGCGFGYRMREFEKYGWTVIGTEPSANARNYAASMMLNLIKADFEEIPSGLYNLVLIEDIIEEVPEPNKLAAAAQAALSPNGVVCVSVPAPAEDEVVAEGKLYRFGEDSLRRLFMQNGFDMPRVKTDSKLRMWFRLKRKL
ncbi:MAG: class I SAM-dependent methyltransferase [Planctomycetota bacterium]|nr:MAG: class I SAM-dependent methyltransferase [Planctomycetota bacterium]